MPTGLFSPSHIAFVLVIALIVLGPKRLPELARAAGRGLREFRDAVSDAGVSELRGHEEPAAPAVPAASSGEAEKPTGSGA